MADVVAGLSREFESDIALGVIDGSAPEGRQQLFADPRVQSVNTPRQLFRQVQFGGRTWTLRMRPLPAFEDRYEYETHHISALFGVVLSIVLGWFAWLLATGRTRAEALAYRMTAELRGTRDELASTLNAIPDLLMEIDEEGRMLPCRSGHQALLAEVADSF